MNKQTYETFTRDDAEKCRVLVSETAVAGRAEPVREYFIDDPRERLEPDAMNQGWFVASESRLRYQR